MVVEGVVEGQHQADQQLHQQVSLSHGHRAGGGFWHSFIISIINNYLKPTIIIQSRCSCLLLLQTVSTTAEILHWLSHTFSNINNQICFWMKIYLFFVSQHQKSFQVITRSSSCRNNPKQKATLNPWICIKLLQANISWSMKGVKNWKQNNFFHFFFITFSYIIKYHITCI